MILTPTALQAKILVHFQNRGANNEEIPSESKSFRLVFTEESLSDDSKSTRLEKEAEAEAEDDDVDDKTEVDLKTGRYDDYGPW